MRQTGAQGPVLITVRCGWQRRLNLESMFVKQGEPCLPIRVLLILKKKTMKKKGPKNYPSYIAPQITAYVLLPNVYQHPLLG